MARENIVVIEDEEIILELVRYNLAKDGYQVTGITTGEEALKRIKSRVPDLVIIDRILPGIDGMEVCKTLRNAPDTQHVPIIMLTAKGEESDIVAGLEMGADDYITKPFSPRILVARVRAVLRKKRRTEVDGGEPIALQDLEIHPGRHEVRVKGRNVDLTFSEFRLLHLLASRPGWVFSRYQIVDSVRGTDYPVTERSVDVQIVGLRKKLGPASKYIETVRGVGYKFKAS